MKYNNCLVCEENNSNKNFICNRCLFDEPNLKYLELAINDILAVIIEEEVANLSYREINKIQNNKELLFEFLIEPFAPEIYAHMILFISEELFISVNEVQNYYGKIIANLLSFNNKNLNLILEQIIKNQYD